MAMLGTAVIAGARYRVTNASMADRSLRIALAAEGAINISIMRLLRYRDSIDLSSTGPLLNCQMPGGEQALVTLEDESRKIDLNTATPQLVAALFGQLTMSASEGNRLAERVIQFRKSRTRAIEAPAQRVQFVSTKGVGPQNLSPFASAAPNTVDRGFLSTVELGDVRGMSPALIRSVRPYVTVQSGQLNQTQELVSEPIRKLLKLSPSTTASQAKPGLASVTLRADVIGPGGARFIREALMSFGVDDKPFLIREWRRGEIASAETWSRSSTTCLNLR